MTESFAKITSERDRLAKTLWTWIHNDELVKHVLSRGYLSRAELMAMDKILAQEILGLGNALGAPRPTTEDLARFALLMCDDWKGRKWIAKKIAHYIPEASWKQIVCDVREIRRDLVALLKKSNGVKNGQEGERGGGS